MLLRMSYQKGHLCPPHRPGGARAVDKILYYVHYVLVFKWLVVAVLHMETPYIIKFVPTGGLLGGFLICRSVNDPAISLGKPVKENMLSHLS